MSNQQHMKTSSSSERYLIKVENEVASNMLNYHLSSENFSSDRGLEYTGYDPSIPSSHQNMDNHHSDMVMPALNNNRNVSDNYSDEIEFRKIVLRKLESLQSDIREIKEMLEDSSKGWNKENIDDIDEEIPPEIGLPLRTEADLCNLNEKIKDREFLARAITSFKKIGGKDVHSITYKIMERLMTNELAVQYTWAGTKEKKALEKYNILNVIIPCVRCKEKEARKEDIIDWIRRWLVGAKLRLTREQAKLQTTAHKKPKLELEDECTETSAFH